MQNKELEAVGYAIDGVTNKTGIVELDRTIKEVVKEHWFKENDYFERKIKIGIVKTEIDSFVTGRVYLKSGKSFSCDNSYEEILKKYLEA